MDVPDAFSGLDDDEKRALSLLQRPSATHNARKMATAPDALAKARMTADRGYRAAPDNAPTDPPARLETPSTEETRNGRDPAEGAAAEAGRSGPVSASRDPDPARPETGTVQPQENSAIVDVPGMGQSFPLRPLEIRLPNAHVSKPYSAIPDRPVLKVVDDARSGLSDDANGNLVGTPEDAGDHVLSLEIADPDGTPRPAKARLTVIADPRDLWVSLPSDRSDPHRKEDGVVITQSSPHAFLLAGSLRGRSHAQKGGFRKDDVALGVNEDGWHILVVADGAGSAKLSGQASPIAVEIAATPSMRGPGPTWSGALNGCRRNWASGRRT